MVSRKWMRCKASGKTEERQKGRVADEKIRIVRNEDGGIAKVRDTQEKGMAVIRERGH
jgi:hypothetical protein